VDLTKTENLKLAEKPKNGPGHVLFNPEDQTVQPSVGLKLLPQKDQPAVTFIFCFKYYKTSAK